MRKPRDADVARWVEDANAPRPAWMGGAALRESWMVPRDRARANLSRHGLGSDGKPLPAHAATFAPDPAHAYQPGANGTCAACGDVRASRIHDAAGEEA